METFTAKLKQPHGPISAGEDVTIGCFEADDGLDMIARLAVEECDEFALEPYRKEAPRSP